MACSFFAKSAESEPTPSPFVWAVEKNGFAGLNQESQNFFINHGAEQTTSYGDLMYFINSIAYYKAYYSLPSLDKQIRQIALSHSVEIKPLDNNNKLNEDFYSKVSFNKPLLFINRSDIEGAIKEIENITSLYHQIFLNTARLYKFYDINMFPTIKNNRFYERFLLKSRNKLWLKKFLSAHEKYDSIFIAGELKYFVGDHSMLNMLENEEFTIKRMTCAN